MNEMWERVLANSFSGIHKSKIIYSADSQRRQTVFCIENSRRVGHIYHPIHTKLVVALCYIHVPRTACIHYSTNKTWRCAPPSPFKVFLLLSNYYNINSLKQETQETNRLQG
jgi:hypothetical protein